MYIAVGNLEMLLKIELNNRAKCKNATKFLLSVTVSIYNTYTRPRSL